MSTPTVETARRWLLFLALALGLGAAVIGTPARHAGAAHAAPATVIRGC